MTAITERINRFIKRASWQHVSIVIVGFLALGSIFFALFTPIGKSIKPLKVKTPIDVSTPEFLDALSNLTQTYVSQAEDIQILINGDEFVASLYPDLEGAQKTINIASYIWEDGVMNDQLFAILTRKQKEGVEVRILLDAFGGKLAPVEDIKKLEEAGGRVEYFRPVTFGKLSRIHQRNHRRVFVIDGKTAYTGGMGIEDKWLGNAQNEHEWRDTMFKMRNRLALANQAAFVELWTSTTGEVLHGEEFYPSLLYSERYAQKNTSPAITLSSNPELDISSLSKFMALSIHGAKKSIYIETPYFIPDRAVQNAILQKAKEGVEIVILLPNDHTDTKSVRWAAQSFYTQFLNAGVRIYEYQPTFNHTKAMVIDDVWSVIGSANMDNRSLHINHENTIGIQNTVFAQELKEMMKKDLEDSIEITLETWKERSLLAKGVQYLSRLFVQQF